MPNTPASGPRVALVTGGSRGIGRAIAVELARGGYAVVVNYAAREDAAQRTVAEIEAAGGQAVAQRGDVGAAEDRRALVDATLERYGRLDLLVNNAGITSPGRRDLLEVTEQGWDAVLATNLKGPFFLSQLAARAMIEQNRAGTAAGGKIINISSISGYAVSADRADYCIAKSALSMVTWLFAARLADEQIGVFEVCPGVIASDMTAAVREKYDRMIEAGAWPIRRWGQPEDVARAVAALARGALPFCTGQRIDIDGGFHIRRLGE